jgi:hypothetical protein
MLSKFFLFFDTKTFLYYKFENHQFTESNFTSKIYSSSLLEKVIQNVLGEKKIVKINTKQNKKTL